jgi:hypothetical protein
MDNVQEHNILTQLYLVNLLSFDMTRTAQKTMSQTILSAGTFSQSRYPESTGGHKDSRFI